MLKPDFVNVLRLDSCFRFLTVGDRIHLHHFELSEEYFNELPPIKREKLVSMEAALQKMEWEIPSFNTMREDKDANRYFVVKTNKGELSEADYAKMYQEEFETFKSII